MQQYLEAIKKVLKSCKNCGGPTNFEVQDRFYAIPAVNIGGDRDGIDLSTGLPSVVVICKGCGYLHFFHKDYLG